MIHKFMKEKKLFFQKKKIFCQEQYGFTIVEILLVTLIIGLTFSVSLPLFGAVINKARQKEATLIVNSVLKAVKANYALEAFLPTKIKPLKKFAIFHKCISEEVAIKGSEVCNSNTIAKADINDNYFFSPSGNYKVEFKTTEISNSEIIFQVRAIPNGLNYRDKGSSVTGCFNPIVGISNIKEYSFLNVGEKEFMSCFTALQIKKAELARKAEEERKAELARKAEEEKPKCIYWNPRSSKTDSRDCWKWSN